jgi:hypothetical protein
MPNLAIIPQDFAKHEDAIELLWTVYAKVVEALNDYVAEELTGTQAMHSLLAITGASDDAIRLAIGAAIMESSMHIAWRANELADALIESAARRSSQNESEGERNLRISPDIE